MKKSKTTALPVDTPISVQLQKHHIKECRVEVEKLRNAKHTSQLSFRVPTCPTAKQLKEAERDPNTALLSFAITSGLGRFSNFNSNSNSWSCSKTGAGNRYGRWTHFILNIKDWLTFLCQSIKVRNTLHGFETMKLFNVFILLLHMDADGLRAFYYLVQDSKCICVPSHWSPLPHQTHLFWTVMCFVYCQFSRKRT